MLKTISLLVLVLLAAACTRSNPVVLRGEEAKQYDQDLTACRAKIEAEREKLEQDSGEFKGPTGLDVMRARAQRDQLVNRCMEGRGYRIVR
jgi:hypothetical protein